MMVAWWLGSGGLVLGMFVLEGRPLPDGWWRDWMFWALFCTVVLVWPLCMALMLLWRVGRMVRG